MDPASLGIGIVSLTFQIFSGCVKSYQLLSEAKGMPKEFQYLRVRLKTEQYRLLDWAHVANLDEQDEGLLISNASKGLLIDVLDQQQRLLARFGRFDERYQPLRFPLISDAPPDESQEPTSPMGFQDPLATVSRADTFQSRFPQSELLLKKSLAWAKSTRNYPHRLAWASWDKAKVEALIVKLTALNDFMRELLNSNQLQLLNAKQTRTEFQIMQLNGKVDQLMQIFDSAVIIQSNPRLKGPVDPLALFMQVRGIADGVQERPVEGKMHNLAALAQTKALNSAIEDDSLLTDDFARGLQLSNNASHIKSVELDHKLIHVLDSDHEDGLVESHRVEALYTNPGPHRRGKQQVWIEWKTYDPENFNGGPNKKVQERIRQLAALLKEPNRTEQFGAPRCLGYFRDVDAQGEDRCRFGLVFEKPKGVHASTRPTSLLDLLRDPGTVIPSLTDRILLMTRIAECIERLHAVNWLHKGLRSNNILFFSEHSGRSGPGNTVSMSDVINDIDFGSPYISGFDYSRPAQNEDMTEKPPENAAYDLYRHPRVQGSGNRDPIANSTASISGSGFKKSYDLYSLGVILLEIAYWQPIDAILSIPNLQDARPSTTIKVRQRLIGEDFLGFVKSRLGNTVEAVVSACLDGPRSFGLLETEDERTEEVGARLQKGFYENVVAKLQAMKV